MRTKKKVLQVLRQLEQIYGRENNPQDRVNS